MSLDGLTFLSTAGAEPGSLPFVLLVVFGSAKLLAEIFERFNQPGMVGEILAGILIGPSVLGWIAPSDLLSTLSELGVMFLLFRVGLEVRPSELLRVGGTATLAATLGVAAPFVLGWGILRLWQASQIESIFVGAAMVATSVGITAHVLSTHGVLWRKSSQVILAAAVIDDVLGLLVLAVVSNVARGSLNPLELLLTAALAAGFTVLVATWGTKGMKRFVPRMEQTLRAAEAQFALSLTVLFALCLAAVYAGVAAIVGAFLAGMALAENVRPRVQDLARGVTELLVPFFLAGIGMRVDLSSFARASGITLAALILGAAILSKLVGCGLGALSLGRTEALRVGLGMVPRGEVGMVVAQIGLGMGVIRREIYSVVVFMAVATTLAAPLLLRVSHKGVLGEEFDRRPGNG